MLLYEILSVEPMHINLAALWHFSNGRNNKMICNNLNYYLVGRGVSLLVTPG